MDKSAADAAAVYEQTRTLGVALSAAAVLVADSATTSVRVCS